jgi:putative Mg2+ transporter-C (MgtC) family protein
LEKFSGIMIAEIELILRLLLALGLRALVGFEREYHDRPAGVRTHILVCMGAAIFMIISLNVPAADPSRIAAGVVTGIGFLGAGAIFRSKDHVQGLTTAADLWVIAGIGLAIGLGYYLTAIVSAIIVFVILFLGRRVKSLPI